MSTPHNGDIITAKTAQEILGIKSRPTFYDVLRRVRATHGIELRHYPFQMARRAYYLRSEIEAVARGDYDWLRAHGQRAAD